MDADALSDDFRNEVSDEGEPQLEPPSDGNELIASENATGTDTVPHEENEALEDLSDASDTGWDTDLEIEDEKDEYDPTGCKDYFKTCNALGIIPVSSFVKTLREGRAEVLLKHHGLGPKGAKAVAIALTTNTTVTHLDISDNGLEAAGGIAIATMLKDNNYIVHLDLSDNFLGSPAAFAIGVMAKVNSTITHCYLSGNSFDDKAAEPIGEMIRGSYRITHLNLSRNEFGEEGGTILGSALAESEVLQNLDLSWNHIRGKGAIAIAEGLKSSQTLKVLNMSANGFGNDGAIALANALKMNTTLEELDISNNRVGQNGAMALSKVLPINDGLKVLMLGKNPLEPKDIEPILNAVKGSSNSALQCLSFERNTLTLQVEKLVVDVKDAHPNLEIIYAVTQGHQIPKPNPPALEKLKTFATDNKLELKDLFQSFDKEHCGLLSEEDFRNALKHISAPLIEIEKQRLVKQFQKEKLKNEEQGKDEEIKEEKPTEEGPVLFVDYNALISS